MGCLLATAKAYPKAGNIGVSVAGNRPQSQVGALAEPGRGLRAFPGLGVNVQDLAGGRFGVVTKGKTKARFDLTRRRLGE